MRYGGTEHGLSFWFIDQLLNDLPSDINPDYRHIAKPRPLAARLIQIFDKKLGIQYMTSATTINSKLDYSIRSLSAWVEKILAESSGKEWRLANFLNTFDISELQRFYLEMEPYIMKLGSDQPQLFGELSSTFQKNRIELSEAMKEHFFYGLFSSIALDIPFIGRSADALVDTLNKIRSHLLNLQNSMKVWQS